MNAAKYLALSIIAGLIICSVVYLCINPNSPLLKEDLTKVHIQEEPAWTSLTVNNTGIKWSYSGLTFTFKYPTQNSQQTRTMSIQEGQSYFPQTFPLTIGLEQTYYLCKFKVAQVNDDSILIQVKGFQYQTQ